MMLTFLYELQHFENEEGILLQASKILRSDLFDDKNDDSTLPLSLITFVKMIIYGPEQPDSNNDSIPLVIAELLSFHAVKRRRKDCLLVNRRRHNKDKQTSTPLYLAAKLYGETRKRTLIESTFHLGMSISYSRLQNLLTEKANSICEMYHRDNVVCPLKLNHRLFTTAAVDNIDHNPTSTTSKTSFHGTAITLMQHSMPEDNGISRLPPPISTNSNKVMQLSSDYALVLPCFIDLSKYACSQSDNCTHIGSNNAVPQIEETEWLDSTMTDDFKSWAAYHASKDKSSIRHWTEVALLPLFTEQAHTPAMMAHTMNIVMKSIKFIDPDQVPVLVADQPLYALLKKLQFVLPDKYGEHKILIMMGGLHIEMAALKLIGQWLKDSGWCEALVEAQVTTQGRSDSMLQATSVTRTRYAYEITAAALYALQKKAYLCSLDENDTQISFEQWRLEKNALIPQFKFWDTALNLALIVLRFVRSTRNGDFYVNMFVK